MWLMFMHIDYHCMNHDAGSGWHVNCGSDVSLMWRQKLC